MSKPVDNMSKTNWPYLNMVTPSKNDSLALKITKVFACIILVPLIAAAIADITVRTKNYIWPKREIVVPPAPTPKEPSKYEKVVSYMKEHPGRIALGFAGLVFIGALAIYSPALLNVGKNPVATPVATPVKA